MISKDIFKISSNKSKTQIIAIGVLTGFLVTASITIAQTSSENQSTPNPIQIAQVENKPANTAANFTNSVMPNTAPVSSTSSNKPPITMFELAGYYASFIAETTRAARPENLASAVAIANSIDNSSLHTRPITIDGVRAFAVIAATRNQGFTAGIAEKSQELGPKNLIAVLKYNPKFVRTISGYSDAKNYSANSLELTFNRINAAHKTIMQASYDVQKFDWSQKAQDKQLRLTAVSQNLETPAKAASLTEDIFSQSGNNTLEISDKIMSSAVMLQLGDETSAMEMLNLGDSASCTNRAYLNVKMCLAASKFPYEHSFCLAKHAYEEVQGCVTMALK